MGYPFLSTALPHHTLLKLFKGTHNVFATGDSAMHSNSEDHLLLIIVNTEFWINFPSFKAGRGN